MPYIRCPTCNKILGNRYPILANGLKEIYAQKTTSEEEKLNKHEKLVKSLELNPCCNSRLITTINKDEILIT
jgi:DNA-directed RNA polymerase subunit N (RpoN/RPB10)